MTRTTLQRAIPQEAVTFRTGTRAVASPAALPAGGCYTVEGGEHGPYRETFAKVYGTEYVKGSVDQYYESSHTIGVAVKGAIGGWGASGTARVDVSSSAGYKTSFNIVDAAVANNVLEKYYYTKCNTSGEWEPVATVSKPIRITSGPYFTRVAHTNYKKCDTAYSGIIYSRKSGTNGTIAGGMDLPFVNTSAQSGWDSKTTLEYKFTKGGSICGSDDTWMYASALSAKA